MLKTIIKRSKVQKKLSAPYYTHNNQKNRSNLSSITSIQNDLEKTLTPKNYVFIDSPSPYWKELVEQTTINYFKRRDNIYLSGDATDNVYLVMKGLVMLSQLQKNGTEVGQSIVIQHCTFGELEVLNQTCREQQATALSDCQLYVIPAKLFDRFTENSAQFSRNVAKLINQRHRRSDCRQAYLAILDVPHRLAQLLLEMAYTIGYQDNHGHHFSPCFTHQDMATLIISSRETVCSIMSGFRRSKIIDFDRKHVTILNMQALENY